MNIDLTYIDEATAEQIGITLETVDDKVVNLPCVEDNDKKPTYIIKQKDDKSSYIEMGLLLLEFKKGLTFTTSLNQKERYQRLRNYYRTRITSTTRDEQETKKK